MRKRFARLLRTRRQRWSAAAIVVLVVAALTWAVWPTSAPAPVATSVQLITVPGGPGTTGTVTLDTTEYLPARTPAPAVILAHGFGGSKDSVAAQAQDLARAGFVVLAYSARGFGHSTGQIALDSLDYEVPDARALVSWLGTRAEVEQDGPDDPRVGVTGGSYGGALSLLLAGTDPRVDAVAAVETWNDLAQALFPNDAGPAGRPAVAATPAAIPTRPDGVFKKSWAAVLMTSVLAGTALDAAAVSGTGPPGSPAPGAPPASAPSPGPSPAPGSAADAPGCGRMLPALCRAYAAVAQTGRITPALADLLERSSPAQVAGKITAPTLLVQGEQDTLFGLDQADATARAIAAAGTTVAVSWYAGGHDGGAPDPATSDRITSWLLHYLMGAGPAPSTAFQYTVSGTLSDTGRARNRTLQVAAYPGLAADSTTPRRKLSLSGGSQTILNPPGGAPAGISTLPGLGSLGTAALGRLSGGVPGQTTRFTSAPLAATTVVTGSPRVTVSISRLPVADPGGGAAEQGVLFGSLVSVGADGSTMLAGGAVAPFRLPDLPADGRPVAVTIDLPAVAFQVAAGNAIQVRVSTTDQAYAGDTATAVYQISMDGDGALLPEVGGVRVSAGEEPIGLLIALVALALLAAAALTLAGRVRPRRRVPDSVGTAVPLQISALAKTYPGGVRAVESVTFDVRSGQVLGLLGPNGSGKTTTLRMVMGLITPTAGSITVFGRPVRPSAEILSRIGSFVEGSGFLPHLSGRTNLELYWCSTGRPAADAHLAQALDIAGLGAAIRRRVKTYSQGMRQRLAIAQAMLGLPDLLLLDEPTNGLDPPQIHAMREVLRRYAGTGRTVLISSHLLSEVEQTCSHVVIINNGRSIAAGTVADMIARSGDTLFTVDDPTTAATVLTTLPNVGEAIAVNGGVQVDLGAVPVSDALRALVRAGVAVSGAAPRNRLEDVFLQLVGSSSASGAGSASAAPTDAASTSGMPADIGGQG